MRAKSSETVIIGHVDPAKSFTWSSLRLTEGRRSSWETLTAGNLLSVQQNPDVPLSPFICNAIPCLFSRSPSLSPCGKILAKLCFSCEMLFFFHQLFFPLCLLIPDVANLVWRCQNYANYIRELDRICHLYLLLFTVDTDFIITQAFFKCMLFYSNTYRRQRGAAKWICSKNSICIWMWKWNRNCFWCHKIKLWYALTHN